MEDVEESLIVDIDSADKKNMLAAVEYIDDIHAYYKKTEVRNYFNYFLNLLLLRAVSCALINIILLYCRSVEGEPWSNR